MTWLNKILEKICKFIPEIWVIDPDEAGIRVTPKPWGGVWVKNLVPGGYFVWPIIQNIEKIKIKTQTVDLRPQSIWTKDGREVFISGSIKYRVTDAQKAILEVFDYDENVKVLALGIIFTYVSSKELVELYKLFETLREEIRKGLRDACAGWGLKIEEVYITDAGKTRNIRLLLNESLLSITAG